MGELVTWLDTFMPSKNPLQSCPGKKRVASSLAPHYRKTTGFVFTVTTLDIKCGGGSIRPWFATLPWVGPCEMLHNGVLLACHIQRHSHWHHRGQTPHVVK